MDDLVPTYLSKVPEDPFGGQPLIYRPHCRQSPPSRFAVLVHAVDPDAVEQPIGPMGFSDLPRRIKEDVTLLSSLSWTTTRLRPPFRLLH